MCRWLLEERGLDVNHGTADGTTAFCWAAWQGHEATCRQLAAAGANPHAANSYGCTAAMWAAQGAASLGLCQYLHRELGVDFCGINATGQGCLHKAAQRGHADVAEWLVGPEVRLLSEHTAVLSESRPNARLHCEPNKSEGSRPSDLARSSGHADLAAWLELREAEGRAAEETGAMRKENDFEI